MRGLGLGLRFRCTVESGRSGEIYTYTYTYTYSPPFAPASTPPVRRPRQRPLLDQRTRRISATRILHPAPPAARPNVLCFGSRAQRCRGHLTGGVEAGDRSKGRGFATSFDFLPAEISVLYLGKFPQTPLCNLLPTPYPLLPKPKPLIQFHK